MMEYNQERRWDTTESYFSCDLNNKEAIGFNGIYGTSWNINGKLGMAMFGLVVNQLFQRDSWVQSVIGIYIWDISWDRTDQADMN